MTCTKQHFGFRSSLTDHLWIFRQASNPARYASHNQVLLADKRKRRGGCFSRHPPNGFDFAGVWCGYFWAGFYPSRFWIYGFVGVEGETRNKKASPKIPSGWIESNLTNINQTAGIVWYSDSNDPVITPSFLGFVLCVTLRQTTNHPKSNKLLISCAYNPVVGTWLADYPPGCDARKKDRFGLLDRKPIFTGTFQSLEVDHCYWYHKGIITQHVRVGVFFHEDLRSDGGLTFHWILVGFLGDPGSL